MVVDDFGGGLIRDTFESSRGVIMIVESMTELIEAGGPPAGCIIGVFEEASTRVRDFFQTVIGIIFKRGRAGTVRC